MPGPCPEALANSALTAPLSKVVFVGPGDIALPAEVQTVLADVGAGLDGRAQPLAEICRLRDEASAALQRARFVAAVQVPEQELADGVLRLRVTTARIVELRVRGDAGKGQARLEKLLERLRALDPLNEQEAERILLLANDIPGTQVTLELRPAPSGQAGEVIGEILLQRDIGSVVTNVQNYGSTQIGRWSGVIRGELYGITGLADRTYLSVFSTSDVRELVVVQGGHDFAAGNDGLRFAANMTYAKTRPTLPNAAANFALTSESILASLSASYPLVRSTTANVRVGGGFDLIDQRTRALGQLINLDQVRAAWLRLDGDVVARRLSVLAPAWRLGAYAELRQGLGVLGATPVGGGGKSALPTRFEGNSQAFVFRAGLNGEARVRFGPNSPYAATLATDIRGQWTPDPLLAFDEFAVGNLTLGRGYDPGATAGDRVVGASTEVRLGKPVPLSTNDIAFEALGFYDHVELWNLDSNNFERRRTLRSIGGGVRATFGNHMRLDLVYAKPLDRNLAIDVEKPGARLLLSLTVRALPWR
ncbi:heme:hemopexin-binding protein [Polymorphobacter multimanifer]|nr:heme:hemopexin-binding protein [Polymorphobacter multimanifer]